MTSSAFTISEVAAEWHESLTYASTGFADRWFVNMNDVRDIIYV